MAHVKSTYEAWRDLGGAVDNLKADINRLLRDADGWLRSRRWFREFGDWANRHLP